MPYRIKMNEWSKRKKTVMVYYDKLAWFQTLKQCQTVVYNTIMWEFEHLILGKKY